MKKILQFCLFIFCVNTLYSQTNCLNFTNLSSSNVTCYYGTNSNPYQNIGLVPNRHSAITTQGTDKNTCHNLFHIPNGDSSSVRLGNESIGAEAEAISYKISVDTNNFSILLLKYAVVLQDPSHTISQQPRFKLEILNQFDSLISPQCGFADFSAGYTTNGWNYCVSVDTTIKIKGNGDTLISISSDTITYKDWTTIGFDLSQYQGMNIKVRLTSYDCSLGAHYGYAYFSLKCDTKNINVAGCNNNSVNTFRAPEGFNYKWYKISNPSNIVSTQRIVSLVADNSIYNCECSFIEDSNCIFNISVLSQVREPIADFNYNYSISNCKYNISFNNSSFVSNDGITPIVPFEGCESYLWIFHDGDTSILTNPTKTYSSFGAFPVMLIAGINNSTCQDTIVDTIYLSDFRNDIIISGDTIICAGDTTTLYSNDFLTYLWSTSDTTNHVTISPNSSTFLNLNTTDTNGCTYNKSINLIVNPDKSSSISDTICKGIVYNRYGYNFNADTSGLYTLNLKTYLGCDSTVNLTLTVNQPATTNISAEICQGETYILNGFNANTAGLHTQNLQTIKGCDSTVNLKLTVNQPATTNISAEICQGETYILNGFNANTAGLHTQNLQTIKGCDSTVNLTLTVNQPAITNISAEICQGETYILNGFNANTARLHTQNLQTIKGCDSTVNLTLTVNQPATTNISAEICQGETYILNGFNVSTAGLHTQNLQTIKGCDSTVNLTLIVNQPATTNISAEICQGSTYTLNGFNVSTAGLHTKNLQTIKGCDSIVNLTLIVNQASTTNVSAEICQGSTYSLNGFNVSTAGLHTQNLQTIKGCDSTVNLNLTVNQTATTNISAEICQGSTYTLNGFNVSIAGLHTQNLQTIKGCDSTVNLTLIVNQPATTNISAEICQGETYSLNGFNVSTAGLHTQNLKTTKGCDSIVNLTLTVNQPAITNLSAEICQGSTYTLNGFNVSTAGLHTQNLQTIKGCDSIVNLTLIVNQPATTNISAEICQGSTYTLNGFNVSTAGFYTQNLQTTKGCDSIVNLTLIVNQPATTNISDEICQGSTYTLNGFNSNTAGLHTQNLQTIKGCDSTVNLTLTVNQPAITNLTAEICQGETYSLNGFNASTAGIHTQNLQTIKGCDSTVNLSLIVNQPAITNLTAEICQGDTYTLNGFNVSTAGLHTQNLKTIKGCDSIVNLTLSVNPIKNTNLNDTICQGGTYTLNGFNVSAQGSYSLTLKTYLGCDSIVTLNLYTRIYNDTIFSSICSGEIYNQFGFNEKKTGIYSQKYKSIYGCDSIITLNLKVNPIYSDTIKAVTCNGQSYNQNGFNENKAGTYSRHLKTINGCDSIITIKLYSPSYSDTIYASICQGEIYNQNGFNVMNNGIYYRALQSANGCDSTIFLNLHVNPIYKDTIEASICKGETYNQNGFIINEEGIYSKTMQNIYGCDSILTINLTINPNYKDTIFASICKGEVYHENGFYADSEGIYKLDLNCMYGCDSLVVLNLKAKPIYSDTIDAVICNGQIYNKYGFNENKTGLYIQQNNSFVGCDSITYLNLNVIEHPKLDLFLNEEQVVDEFPITLDASCENCSEYYWSTGETTSTINVYSQGKYYVKASNICGITYDSLLILTPEIALYLPNTFITSQITNNTFGIYSAYKDKIEIISFKIYNRWGTIVFETNDIDKFWDGTYEGKYLNSDLFVWLLHYKTKYTGNKIFEKKGDVRLIR